MKTCRNGEFGRSLSAQTVGNNVDLLIEIFLHVPAKSLIRFKSVSKHWLSLISDSRFSMKHTRKNPKPPISGLLAISYKCNAISTCKALSLQNQNNLPNINWIGDINSNVRFRVCDVCNGLILCYTECNSLFVCNPTTRKYIKLPEPFASMCHSSYCRRITANLAFDSSESLHYKVLLTHGNIDHHGQHSYEDFIYSSESTSWEKMSVHIGHSFYSRAKRVFWNKAFHWIDKDTTHFRFDLKNKKLTETPKPPNHWPQGSQYLVYVEILYNGNCGGRYLLLQTTYATPLICDVLEMKKDDYSWNIKHTLDFTHTYCRALKLNHCFEFNYCVSVLCLLEGNGRDDLEVVICTRDGVITYFNLNSSKTEVVQQSLDGKFLVDSLMYPLIESLAPVCLSM